MDWLFIASTPETGAPHFSGIRHYEKTWQLDQCMSLRGAIPPDAEIGVKPGFSKATQLVDSLYSDGSVLFVNERVCKLFEAQGIRNVEYLPIKVLDYKKKPVKKPYFIVNILTKVDCIDLTASQVTWNSIDPEMIGGVTSLVLDPERLPTDVKLFRPVRMPYVMLIHRTAADAIRAEGLQGFFLQEVPELQYP